MFRMLRVRPPNGWPAVWWELAIVSLGVLIALIAQQWADGRSWSGKTEAAQGALRQELAEHYTWSVEWRVVAPCLRAQIEQLQQRVLNSGATLAPAPVIRNGDFVSVFRPPNKEYTRSAYDTAVHDGVVQRFEPALRSELSVHYQRVENVAAMVVANGEDYRELLALSRPIPLDPSVRFELLRTLDRLAGRISFMEILAGHLVGHVSRVDMVPPPERVRREVEHFGTWQFCRDQKLPLRSWREASAPLAN